MLRAAQAVFVIVTCVQARLPRPQQPQLRRHQVVEEAVFVSAKDERAMNLDAVLVEEAWRLPGVGLERPASYRKLQRLVVDGVNRDGSEVRTTFVRPWGADVPVTTLSGVYRVAFSKCGYSGAERNVSALLTWLHNLGVLTRPIPLPVTTAPVDAPAAVPSAEALPPA